MKRNLYSREQETRTVDGGRIDQLPRFAFEYSFDDRMRPSEVTIFDPDSGAGIMTNWLTAPTDIAIPVEDCR